MVERLRGAEVEAVEGRVDRNRRKAGSRGRSARLAPYYARVRGALERYGGTVEKFIGDAVVALFGAPLAHEDDVERAVRAALAVRASVAALNEQDEWLVSVIPVSVSDEAAAERVRCAVRARRVQVVAPYEAVRHRPEEERRRRRRSHRLRPSSL